MYGFHRTAHDSFRRLKYCCARLCCYFCCCCYSHIFSIFILFVCMFFFIFCFAIANEVHSHHHYPFRWLTKNKQILGINNNVKAKIQQNKKHGHSSHDEYFTRNIYVKREMCKYTTLNSSGQNKK